MTKLVIGLTGGIGSGKTTVANLFREKHIDIIDTDVIARDVVQPNTETLSKIVAHFGPQVLMENKTLDRRKLRQIIFDNQQAKVWLENLLHPLIMAEVRKKVEASRSPYCIVVIPLLIETNAINAVNRILVVDTTEALQIDRITTRDHLSNTQAKNMIEQQTSREQRNKNADDIIVNDGDLDKLAHEVEMLHKQYCQLANVKSDPG